MRTAIVLAGFLVAPALSQGSQPEHLAQLRELAAANQPAGENGYALLQQIAPRVESLERSLINEDCYFDYAWHSSDLSPAEHARRLRQIHVALEDARASGLLGDFAALAATDHLLPPRLGEWTDDERGDCLRATRSIARINAARFVLALERGDHAEALAAVRETVWLSRRIAALSLEDPFMSAAATELLTLARVRDQLVVGRIDAALAAKLLEVISSEPSFPSVMTVFEGERVLRRRDIGLLYNRRGELVAERLASFVAPGLDPSQLDPDAAGDPTLPGLSQMLAWDDEFSEPLAAIAGALPNQRPTLRDRLSEDWGVFDAREPPEVARLRIYSAILPAAVPLTHFADNVTLNQVGTRIMLAIEVYSVRHDAPPATLSELMPDILLEVPVDPFTGDIPIYRLDPGTPRGYVLYSAGFDAIDQGGSPWPDAGSAYKVLSPGGEGFDYVFVGR